MKKLLFILFAIIVSSREFVFAQEIETDSVQMTLNEENYKLYPTENMWTFLKLDTRTGKVWQVQYSVNSDNYGEVVVNDWDLTYGENDKAGRFELYPTKNIHNFLLLDKKDGIVVQVQWSMNADNRGLINIISYGHY